MRLACSVREQVRKDDPELAFGDIGRKIADMWNSKTAKVYLCVGVNGVDGCAGARVCVAKRAHVIVHGIGCVCGGSVGRRCVLVW